MSIQKGDEVKIEYTGKLKDGTIFDTSRKKVAENSGLAENHPEDREYNPLEIQIGKGEIIEGLENGLLGLEEGKEKTIKVPPEKGYGKRRQEKIETYELSEFRQILQGEEPEEGMFIQTEQGQIGEIIKVDEKNVEVDFNHQLAGKELEFEVEILEVN